VTLLGASCASKAFLFRVLMAQNAVRERVLVIRAVGQSHAETPVRMVALNLVGRSLEIKRELIELHRVRLVGIGRRVIAAGPRELVEAELRSADVTAGLAVSGSNGAFGAAVGGSAVRPGRRPGTQQDSQGHRFPEPPRSAHDPTCHAVKPVPSSAGRPPARSLGGTPLQRLDASVLRNCWDFSEARDFGKRRAVSAAGGLARDRLGKPGGSRSRVP
jgi:hypothetical protein